jgi:ABC-type polysaccharide/polyol phosphate transport system ATPase subunit
MTIKPISISMKGVSKKFRLFNSPKERLWEALHPFKKKYHKEFWALKDINFYVPKGTTVGIIGRNGSGKSTLLQIICSVLKPTTGIVQVNGKVSALLELGADFCPEFTGRENIFQKGIRMGFSRAEMQERILMIEAFADIGEFIDQPMRLYSSGMFLRLAFAAAINVDPDILIIDEALAVGDAKFQQKCYERLDEFRKTEKTIVIVTHDIESVNRHCDMVVLLNDGKIASIGQPMDVSVEYHKLLFDTENMALKSDCAPTTVRVNQDLEDIERRIAEELIKNPSATAYIYRQGYNRNEQTIGNGRAKIEDFVIEYEGKINPTLIESGGVLNIYCRIKAHDNVLKPLFGFEIKAKDGLNVYSGNTEFQNFVITSMCKGDIVVYRASIWLDLISGDYFISNGVGSIVGREKHVPLDFRYNYIHITVANQKRFTGVAYFDTEYEQYSLQKFICDES